MVSARIKYISLVMSCLFISPVTQVRGAEEAISVPAHAMATLRLSDLLSEATEKNASLKAATEETNVSDAAIRPAGAFENPVLGIEAMNFPVNSLSQSEFGMTGIQLSLSQRIPFPGKLSKLKTAASFIKDSRTAQAEAKRFELIRDVKKAFFELVLSFRKKEILEEQKNLVTQILTVTRNNYSVGRAQQVEVLNLQLEQTTLLDQILITERKIKEGFGELSHLLGRASHEGMVGGKPESIKKTPFNFSKFTEAFILEKAVLKNRAVAAMQSEVKAADAKLSYARWGYLPDFDFKFGYTFRKESPGDNGTDFVSGMVGLSIPLWFFERQSEEKRGAEAERSKSEALLNEERNSVSHSLHETYAALEEAQDRLKLFEGGVLPLARQAVLSAKAAYATKKVDYATVLSLLGKRLQTENAYIEALVSYEQRIAELEALVGGSLEEL